MTESQPFVAYLEGLSQHRAAMAALRRGLGRPPATVSDMFRYVVPWVPEEASRRYENALYLIASLYAHHRASGGVGNMGDHFARARNPAAGDTAIERRFTAVLRSHPDDFPLYLRQAVSYLKSKEIAVNWHQLLRDVLAWSHPDHYVQKRWARGFWGSAARPDIASEDR